MANKPIDFDELDKEFEMFNQQDPNQPSQSPLTQPAASAPTTPPPIDAELAKGLIQSPNTSPDLKAALAKKFDLGEYNDENRKKLVEDSKLGIGDRISAALGAAGAGIMGKDATGAGQAILNARKAEKMGALDAFDKGRKSKIEDYNLDRQLTGDERADKSYADNQAILERERDPNSVESKMAQDLAKSMGYKGDVSGLTAEKFKAFSPALQKAYEIKERALDRQESRETREFARQQARQDKLDQNAKPSDKQVQTVTDFDNALDAIKSIETEKGNFDTGPLAGRLNSAAQYVGLDDSKKSAFRSQVQDQLAQYIKSISGGAVSDQERASLLQNLPNMNDNDETFNAKLKATKERLERNRDNQLNNLEKQGKNVKAFKKDNTSGGYPKQVRKGNQVATVSNAQEEKEANDEGFM